MAGYAPVVDAGDVGAVETASFFPSESKAIGPNFSWLMENFLSGVAP